MSDIQEQFFTKNLSLTDISQIAFVQVGYDTDGSFEDYNDTDKFLKLTCTGNSEVTASFEALNNDPGITDINIIKIIGAPTGNLEVLAYRTLNYTVKVVPSEDSMIRVKVELIPTTIGELTGTIDLDYLEHSEARNPVTVHPQIDHLPFQGESPSDLSDCFPSILEDKTTAFDTSATDKLQRLADTPVYYAGRGHTYSNLLWYYWNPTAINEFLTQLADKFSETPALAQYVTDIQASVSSLSPFLGFNARYGSYLYWYDISADYICVIYVGSNHYNAVDIFIVPNTLNLYPTSCSFFDGAFRIKFNRWYNHLYFVYKGRAYQINTNLEKSIFSKEIKQTFTYNDDSEDALIYKIRAFQTNVNDAIQLAYLDTDPNHYYYQTEFSDLGDVLIYGDRTVNQEPIIGIRNIFDSTYATYTLDERIDASSLYSVSNRLFNKYMIDDANTAYRLMGIYQTTLVHLQYFIKNNYNPVYLGPEYSIAYSYTYGNYLTLFKTPTKAARRRDPSNWLNGCLFIHQDLIGRPNEDPNEPYIYCEEIYTGDGFVLYWYNNPPCLAAERGVIVKDYMGIGAYRQVKESMLT